LWKPSSLGAMRPPRREDAAGWFIRPRTNLNWVDPRIARMARKRIGGSEVSQAARFGAAIRRDDVPAFLASMGRQHAGHVFGGERRPRRSHGTFNIEHPTTHIDLWRAIRVHSRPFAVGFHLRFMGGGRRTTEFRGQHPIGKSGQKGFYFACVLAGERLLNLNHDLACLITVCMNKLQPTRVS
jgi:hypothetical protein